MTEEEFHHVLSGYKTGSTSAFGRHQSRAIQRGIKQLMDIKMKDRHDIDIPEAINYLINERGLIIAKKAKVEVHPDLIRKELKEWTVSTVLSLNKKDFSNKLSSM